MLTTKRYDYVQVESIAVHPDVGNHRKLDQRKVAHYAQDILKNGLLEPLIVWEKRHGEFFLVGGFHRMAAIGEIRRENEGYFDRVDVRVVAGDLEEIRALNLKLNADRLDAKITDYFETVIFLNNANWTRERIAQFLDRSISWIGDIIRYAPLVDRQLRELIDEGKVSWAKAKTICRAIEEAEPGKERSVLEAQLASAKNGNSSKPKKPLTLGKARKRLDAVVKKSPTAKYTLGGDDLMSLILVLEGKDFEDTHVERVRAIFPGLLD
jgi:ParB family chromosome partitioning protein